MAYDVAQERVLWRTGVSDDYIEPSPSGLVASVLSHSDGQRTHLGLLDLTTGKFRQLDIRPPDPHGRAAQKDKASVSDDGALFASVIDGQLGVWSTATTKLLHQQRFGDEYPMTVEFLRGSHDLTVELLAMPATNENPPSLAVLARDGDAWRLEQSFEQVRGFGWTKRGLLLSTAAGISRYDRREVRLLVSNMRAWSATFSADGRYVAHRTDSHSLNVYDFDTKRIVLKAAWLKPARFHGNFVTVMSSGILWRGDLSNGTNKVLHDFGPPSETVKIPFFGGTTTNTHFDHLLNDEGTRLYYVEPHGKARIYDIGKL